MSTLSATVVILLLAVSICVLFFLSKLIIAPIVKIIKTSKINSYQTKKKQSLVDFFNLIDTENYTEALKLLSSVPYLDSPKGSESFLFIRDHNQDFVTKCFYLFEKLNKSTSDLASLEMLFSERFELFTLLFKAQVNKKVLEEKQEAENRKLPIWAKDELGKKEKELNQSIESNLREIEKLIKKISSRDSLDSSAAMTIH